MNDNLREKSIEIKNNLSLEQIRDFLIAFGGNPKVKGNIIISKTICHDGDSEKLYYYNNTKLFKCFTDCGDNFDIYELIIKIKKIKENIELTLPQAVEFIVDFFKLKKDNSFSFEDKKDDLNDWIILENYEKNNNQEENNQRIVELKIYDEKILKYLPFYPIKQWEKEGISKEVMKYCGIKYDPFSCGAVIPHYNIENYLIGIRERTLIKEEEKNGKYKPAILNYQMYSHPLGFNLYGINWAKDKIKKIQKAIIFEGEKSVMLYASYFGIDNLIAVAACGSNLTKYQVELLISAGAKEIIIAFDRQYKEIGDDEWKIWTKKLEGIYQKYSKEVLITFMFDKKKRLEYKMSPIDNGKEIFLELFKERFTL